VSSIESPRFEAVFLSFVEQIGLGTAQIDDLRTSVAIFLLNGALFAIIRIRNSLASTNHTTALVASIVAFVTNSNKEAWTDIGIANDALSITFCAQAANGDAGLFSAHDQIWMMLRHRGVCRKV